MKNQEFSETVKRTEAVVGKLCLYASVFITAGLLCAMVI